MQLSAFPGTNVSVHNPEQGIKLPLLFHQLLEISFLTDRSCLQMRSYRERMDSSSRCVTTTLVISCRSSEVPSASVCQTHSPYTAASPVLKISDTPRGKSDLFSSPFSLEPSFCSIVSDVLSSSQSLSDSFFRMNQCFCFFVFILLYC